MIKIIAIGNRLMGDDGIAVSIAEKWTESFKDPDIEIILCETNSLDCLYRIEATDFVILMDAQLTGAPAGTICLYDLQEILKNIKVCKFQHDMSVMEWMVLYDCICQGYLVGIEAETVEFGYSFSKTLTEHYGEIFKEAEETVKQIIRRAKNA